MCIRKQQLSRSLLLEFVHDYAQRSRPPPMLLWFLALENIYTTLSQTKMPASIYIHRCKCGKGPGGVRALFKQSRQDACHSARAVRRAPVQRRCGGADPLIRRSVPFVGVPHPITYMYDTPFRSVRRRATPDYIHHNLDLFVRREI